MMVEHKVMSMEDEEVGGETMMTVHRVKGIGDGIGERGVGKR